VTVTVTVVVVVNVDPTRRVASAAYTARCVSDERMIADGSHRLGVAMGVCVCVLGLPLGLPMKGKHHLTLYT
jgi:hypothetical protein